MSNAKRINRRSLFDAFRSVLASEDPLDVPPVRGGFSLAAFYDRREATADEQAPFPHVSRREGLAIVETTSIGAGPVDEEKGPPRGGVA